MPLDKQVQIFSVDTGNFYSKTEEYLHKKNHKLRAERNLLVNGGYEKRPDGKIKRKITGVKEIENKLKKYGIDKSNINDVCKPDYDLAVYGDGCEVIGALAMEYEEIKRAISIKNKAINETKNKLLQLLENKVEANIQSNGSHHIRELSENQVSKKNIISVFESSFTRMIGAKQDELCEDFMVVQVYYFDIIKDLIFNGFMYKGEKYVYFTSSAGQIRTKKTVFVKESVWNKYEKTLMCGLTIDEINAKGGTTLASIWHTSPFPILLLTYGKNLILTRR